MSRIYLNEGRLEISLKQVKLLTQLLLEKNLIKKEKDAFDESVRYKLTPEGANLLEESSKQED